MKFLKYPALLLIISALFVVHAPKANCCNPFQSCTQENRQIKNLYKLRHNISDEEVEAARNAYEQARKEKDPFKAYTSFKIAYCGTGKSEYSIAFTAFLNQTIGKFISNKELFIGEDWQIAQKCLAFVKETTINADMELLSDLYVVGPRCERYLFNQAYSMSLYPGDKEQAIKLHKESLFWLLFEVRKNRCIEADLYEVTTTLKERFDAV